MNEIPPPEPKMPEGPEEHMLDGFLFAIRIAEHLLALGERPTRKAFYDALCAISDGEITLGDPESWGDGLVGGERQRLRRLGMAFVTIERKQAQSIRGANNGMLDWDRRDRFSKKESA